MISGDCVSSYLFFFFFSSRRRHTRYWRDWSSDVCSSDLTLTVDWVKIANLGGSVLFFNDFLQSGTCQGNNLFTGPTLCPGVRSEERRVGKECRSRWSPYH